MNCHEFGHELLLTWVKWSLILLKNRALGEKVGHGVPLFGEKCVILHTKF